MARPQRNTQPELIDAIADVFRSEGYEGASLTKLSAATGLRRASLYHRFEGGKEQMAEEALAVTLKQMDEQVLAKLRGLGTPKEKLDAAGKALLTFYDGGSESCLINLFGTPNDLPDGLTRGVQALVSALITAIAQVLEDAGVSEDEARTRSLRAVALLQGALVLSSAFGDAAPFRAMMTSWAEELLPAPTRPERPLAPEPQQTEAVPQVETPAPKHDVRAAVAAHLKGLKRP
ncbi:TetR/AcrR family transcriptional regulator [Parvularcula sp. ZS-1/3]|uniref:TetR/AcrR family transcriptional regulator n=1 Tax=Parvularcula mediterranea TaxID=2732508 RepID=A0A7Y3RMH0_9PROT|nr:TetR/AcrR family transcriptional regulator [Parvularcula mediterranea]NNU16705.1 TetR/AcrR family transcriptional regulator [Parvularcula mediterranea]